MSQVPAAAPSGFKYQKPSWAGRPALSGELAVELIVKGEIKRRIPLDFEEHNAFLFGREKNCDVELEGLEKRASRYHCVLQCKEGSAELYVYDLKSSHGTVVNGKHIDPETYVPLRVGSQIRFNALRPTAVDCLAVICGSEEDMDEEGEIDLEQFRELAAKERQEKEKAMLEDLRRRKAAKKERMHKDATRKLVAETYAAKAEKKMQAVKEAEQRDIERRQQVTWGMSEDAVEIPTDALHDDAQKLMDANGKLDLEKVRKLELTPKQTAMVDKLEQKQRRIANLHKENQRIEEAANHRARKKAEAEMDIDEFVDSGAGQQNLEKLQRLSERMEKAEEDFALQADNLMLSLGLKKTGYTGHISKKRAAMYDTNLNQEDDDFYDRTAAKAPSEKTAPKEADDIPSELMGLPTLDQVENAQSLEAKLRKLQAEKLRLVAQLAAESAKEKQRLAMEDPEDSLDAFMNANVAEIRKERGSKLTSRMEAVTGRIVEFEAMLRKAKVNNEEPLPSKPVASAMENSAQQAPAESNRSASRADSALCAAEETSVGATASSAEATEALSSAATGKPKEKIQRVKHDGKQPAEGSTAAALARLMKKAAADASEEAEGKDSQDTITKPPDVEKPSQTVAAAPARPRKGPERPSAAMLAQAAAFQAPAEPEAPARTRRGPERPSAALLAQAAALQTPAEPSEPVRRRPGPALAHIDPTKAGLQHLGGSGKRPAPSESELEAVQSPPKQRKVYGADMRQPQASGRSRDADQADSGELAAA
eukprot:TRINITY_DN29076_c0_g1_i1.p1 TRINITY_DN29076_c0_g1~~TRINITY_DN29076_c0_g1_i1.p1  ORF type:complete len:782 (-),score=219.18 TRINITY_DN29076_c0_g1_i1:13-2310(-)